MFIPVTFAETAVNSSHTQAISTTLYAIPQVSLILGFLAIFYFLIFRPQQKRQQEREALLNGIKIGDVVYTQGGVVGKLTKVHNHFYQIEVAPNTRLYIQKEAIIDLVPQDSLRSLGFE